MRKLACALLLSLLLVPATAEAARDRASRRTGEEPPKTRLSAATFAGLKLRAIGPAMTSGRIADIAIDPTHPATWIVAAASGGVWRTDNAGTTWTPLFDDQGSYSIGCVALDPNDPLVIWVGTGENNSQRSVSYGDGVYRSLDGGKTWENMGLRESEHIGKILVDPRDGDTVWVAAQGPLWRPGGDRGLYKTTDGGRTWTAVLTISENTGVTDIAFDPRNPDVVYAAAYQRRRHVWTLINGGPESALYKTTDGGQTWRKLEKGLPEVDKGRIGLAVSPVDPNVVYAIVEAQDDKGGFFRSTDAGGTWERRSTYMSSSPQYYNEIVADPNDVDRVYSLDTFMHVTEDGGKTFRRVGGRHKHVDDHALWIDPADSNHLINGNDGGVYESWDRGQTWRFIANLPVTQCYRATADTDVPFYNVYCGTQDNATLGGPARTFDRAGITNGDWFITVFGDGFKTRVDPKNPDIIYSQWQYGGLVRHDRASGEIVDIQPQPEPGEPPLRWNWNSPLIISPHAHTRLYYAAQRLFRSDDRGDSWRPVSPDLTRQLDRNRLEVMDRVWSVDAVAKNASTSFYGNIVSLSESPLVEGLIYVGTDDGLVQVTEDGGETWRRQDSFPGVPEMSYVSHVEADLHDPDVVYAAFDNHKRGDFRPYLLRSDDRGRTWRSIAGDLPERGSVHVVQQDHVRPGLLFAGTEFGLYATIDGGGHWFRLKGGLPTIAVRDIDVQRRENDLVLGTFGRGVFILDDYSPLRHVSEELLEQEAATFPVRDALWYVPRARLGLRGPKAFQGDGFFTAPNPPFGAVLTYHLKEKYLSKREQRRKLERERQKRGEDNPYPSWDELRAEDREEPPAVLLVVRDAEGRVVRRVEAANAPGIQRVAWDLHFPSPEPVSLEEPSERAPWAGERTGPMAPPGEYTLTLVKRVGGEEATLGEPQTALVLPLSLASLPARDRDAAIAFHRRTAALLRGVLGARRAVSDARSWLAHAKKALDETPAEVAVLRERVLALDRRLDALEVVLVGDRSVARRNEPTPPSLVGRARRAASAWDTTGEPTATHRRQFEIARAEFEKLAADLEQILGRDLPALEADLEQAGAPWTPGRIPRWVAPR
ncbi:MAG: glycosyl hydrolase [Acidobacteria bacterium]|nr:MAG: glycosyl hydrolase [Acidobacteriota bacterium]